MLAIRSGSAALAHATRTVVHMRGRALRHSLYIGQWPHFSAIHVDPALKLRQKMHLLTDVARHLEGHPGDSFLLVDWNFVHSDETRILSIGEEVLPEIVLARYFEETFAARFELRQQERRYRRLACNPGDATNLGRIDRMYANIRPSTLYMFVSGPTGILHSAVGPATTDRRRPRSASGRGVHQSG